MSGHWGANPGRPGTTAGKRRQSSPCEGCGCGVPFFEQPRRVRCQPCWSLWYAARDLIIAERLAAQYPSGEPRELDYPSYPDYSRAASAYRSAVSRLRYDATSVADAEILARLARKAVA